MLRPTFPDNVAKEQLLDNADSLDAKEMEDTVQHGLEIIAALEELDAITDDESTSLETILHQVATEGISRDDYNSIEAIIPGALEGVNPAYLTAQRSMQGTEVALESINWKKAGIVAVIVAAVAGLLSKLIKWIASKFGNGGAKNVKMADRVAATVDKIYERLDLADISEAYNRKNPYKGGTWEFSMYESIMLNNKHEDFDTDIYIEPLAMAMVDYQSKVKRKNFDEEALAFNMDYLMNGIRYGWDRHQGGEVRSRIVGTAIGNFLAGNAYNAIEHYIVATPPERSIFSKTGVEIALAQYDYFFLIADRYKQLMNDFSSTMLSVLIEEPVTQIDYDRNKRMYDAKLEQAVDRLYKGTSNDQGREQSVAYTALENRLFDIWEQFQALPEIKSLNKVIGESTSTSMWLFDTNQLIALNTGEQRSKQTFAQRMRGESKEYVGKIMINPSPSGMTTENPMYMYRKYDELIKNVRKGGYHDGMIFNVSTFFNERKYKKIQEVGADTAIKIGDVHLYGLPTEQSVQLNEAIEAIKRVHNHLQSNDYEKRLKAVQADMQQCSRMWEDWKYGFDGQLFNFISSTGHYTKYKDKSMMGGSPFKRSQINIDAIMKAIFTSIRTTASVLAEHSTYLNGIEVHALSALNKRAKAADSWNNFIANKALGKVGKKK